MLLIYQKGNRNSLELKFHTIRSLIQRLSPHHVIRYQMEAAPIITGPGDYIGFTKTVAHPKTNTG